MTLPPMPIWEKTVIRTMRSCYNVRTMEKAIWETIELYCPVCETTFNQLVVLHKAPMGFKIDKYLAGMVENHDHQAYQAFQAAQARAKPVEDGTPPAEPEDDGPRRPENTR